MNMQKKQLKKMTGACCLAVAVGLALNAAAAPTITDVKAQQRYPWNGKFDISYTATGVDEECVRRMMTPALTVYAVERTTHVTNIAKSAYLSGDMTMTNGTHKLVWDMDAQGIFQGVVSTNFEVFVSVDVTPRGVQLWKDGPYWAEYNVGATKPEENGYYFWWGDTVGYKRSADNFGWISVKDGTAFEFKAANCPTYEKSKQELYAAGYTEFLTGNLNAAHDAATAHCDAPWRMPTKDELDALVSNCTTKWITTNGVNGRLVTGKGDYATKSIFFPAAGESENSTDLSNVGLNGHYWSSTPQSDISNYAWPLTITDQRFWVIEGVGYRYEGVSVRPVRVSAQ